MSSFVFYPQSNKKVTADISTWSLGLGEILLVGLVKIIIIFLKRYYQILMMYVTIIIFLYLYGLIHLTMKQTCAWFNKICTCSFSNFIVNVLPQLVSLTCDGLTGAVQERMRAEHHVQSHHMMFNINLWSIGILAICKLRSLCMSKRPADK